MELIVETNSTTANTLPAMESLGAIGLSAISVEPAHERAVGHQRMDLMCLEVGEFERADPADDDDEAVSAENARDAVDGGQHCAPVYRWPIPVDGHAGSPP